MTQLIPARWKHTLETLCSEMYHIFDRWLPKHAHSVATAESPWASSLVLAGGPCVDVEETEDDVIVTAELPGLELVSVRRHGLHTPEFILSLWQPPGFLRSL
jgi:hypothetical protein